MERRPGYSHARKGTRGFYAEVPSFSAFVEFTDPRHYVAAPGDWHVVIADIKGSTGAIAAGRYKDVNMLGASCIAAVLNAVDATDVPFVFGGDGATMLIPPAAEAPVRVALSGLSQLADTAFGMALRVGMVPVAALVDQGRSVLVARFELSPDNHLALFAGGGVELAESLLKDDAAETGVRLEINAADAAEPDLSGLSCRWEPLTARNGVMLAMLVHALDPSPDGAGATYRQVTERVSQVVDSAPQAGNPVTGQSLAFRWPPRGLALEAKTLSAGRPNLATHAKLYVESLLQWLANRFDLTFGPLDGKRYRHELSRNADYRRFDDTLRIIVDCSPAQAAEIETFLEELRGPGWLVYGLHRSDTALMTCLVFSLERSDHLHFVDGADGGFAMAARQLKAQMAAHSSLEGGR